MFWSDGGFYINAVNLNFIGYTFCLVYAMCQFLIQKC